MPSTEQKVNNCGQSGQSIQGKTSVGEDLAATQGTIVMGISNKLPKKGLEISRVSAKGHYYKQRELLYKQNSSQWMGLTERITKDQWEDVEVLGSLLKDIARIFGMLLPVVCVPAGL